MATIRPAASVERHLPLTPAIAQILLALADADRHGYGIMQEIVRLTDGVVRMGPGTLYGTIKRLLAAKLIVDTDDRPTAPDDDERRRCYRSRRSAVGSWPPKAHEWRRCSGPRVSSGCIHDEAAARPHPAVSAVVTAAPMDGNFVRSSRTREPIAR